MVKKANCVRLVERVGMVLVFIVLLLGLQPGSSWAAGERIGFVNLQKAISSTKEFKRLFAAFKNDYKQQKNIIAAKELRIKKMLEDLNKQSFVLDPKKKKQREEKFRQEKVDFERYVQDKNAEFARKEKELTERVLKQMIEVIRQIGKEKNFTMIVEEKVVLYHDSGHDLTNLAIKQYDRIHK